MRAVLLLGSVLLTGAVAAFVCTPPPAASLKWQSLFTLAFVFLALAAAVHAFSIWLLSRLFSEPEEQPPAIAPLIGGLWMPVAWLPLLALLVQEHSIWAAAVPPLILSFAILSIQQGARRPEGTAPDLGSSWTSPLGLSGDRGDDPLGRALPAAAAAALFLEAGIGALMLKYPLAAGCFLAAGIAFPLWRINVQSLETKSLAQPMEWLSDRSAISTARRPWSLISGSVVVFLLTAFVLIPFLRRSPLSSAVAAVLRMDRGTGASSVARTRSSRPVTALGYTSIILLPPPRPHQEPVPPAPQPDPTPSSAPSRPRVIPFDGAYWYFKWPDAAPSPDARIQHGDPAKVNIRSTDALPLVMEAHQHLDHPLRFDCCHAIRVAVRNSDNRGGTIYVEILLSHSGSRDRSAKSLGRLPIPSSESHDLSPRRPAVDEVLSFPFPSGVHGKLFNEITVAIEPSPERAQAGAHVAVQSFEFPP